MSDDCPLDLSDFTPEAIIRRWTEAFIWANGKEPLPMTYERGWFVVRHHFTGIASFRDRRKQVAAMIWRLENKPRYETPTPATRVKIG